MKIVLDFTNEDLKKIIIQHIADKYNIDNHTVWEYDETTGKGIYADKVKLGFSVVVDGETYDNVEVIAQASA